jgi:hypothetical protein
MGQRAPFGRRRVDAAGAPERPLDVFLRGLLSGALVGAVVAGTAIWDRRVRRTADPTATPAGGAQESTIERPDDGDAEQRTGA